MRRLVVVKAVKRETKKPYSKPSQTVYGTVRAPKDPVAPDRDEATRGFGTDTNVAKTSGLAAAAPHPFAATARTTASAHRCAVPPRRPLARRTRRLSRAATQGRRRNPAAV